MHFASICVCKKKCSSAQSVLPKVNKKEKEKKTSAVRQTNRCPNKLHVRDAQTVALSSMAAPLIKCNLIKMLSRENSQHC